MILNFYSVGKIFYSSKNLAYIYTETHFLHVKILEEANLFA